MRGSLFFAFGVSRATPPDGSREMPSRPLVPQAKFKSLTVVSTFELGTEAGSVLQLPEASRWSEVRLEAESESCENSEGGDGGRAPVGFFRTEVSSLGSHRARSDTSELLGSHCLHSCLSFFFFFLAFYSSVLKLALL